MQHALACHTAQASVHRRCKCVALESCRVEQGYHLMDLPLSVRMNCAVTDNLVVQLLRFREGQKYLGFTNLLYARAWWCASLEIPEQYEFPFSVSPKYTFAS